MGSGEGGDKASGPKIKKLGRPSFSSFLFFIQSPLFQATSQMQIIIPAYSSKMQSASLKNGERYVGSPEKITYYCLTNVM